jgi:Ca2+-binding EF-hand superfamily protein
MVSHCSKSQLIRYKGRAWGVEGQRQWRLKKVQIKCNLILMDKIMEGLKKIWDWIASFREPLTDISEEKMEEYRMLSGFKPKEIIRIRKLFLEYTNDQEMMSKEIFLDLESLAHNPLKERIAMCFGFDEEINQLDFQAFLCGLSLFNSPGQREQKLKTAFKLQDFDNDGVLNKQDLMKYIKLITGEALEEKQVDEVANEILKELAAETITFNDFQRVVAASDFQAKLLLPI